MNIDLCQSTSTTDIDWQLGRVRFMLKCVYGLLIHNRHTLLSHTPSQKEGFCINLPKPLVTLLYEHNQVFFLQISRASLHIYRTRQIIEILCEILCTIFPQSHYISIFSEVRSINTVAS